MSLKRYATAVFAVVFLSFLCSCVNSFQDKDYSHKVKLRAPAIPLISIDPYINNWSFSDSPIGNTATHWSGRKRPLFGLLRVDGTTYNFFGKNEESIRYVLPMASNKKWKSKYTLTYPGKNWTNPSFDDSSWQDGVGAYGSDYSEYGDYINTEWDTEDIWIRKKFVLDKDYSNSELYLQYSHDDAFELYINNIQVVGTGNMWRKNVRQYLNDRIKESLIVGENIITMHCHNPVGGSIVDVGIYEVVENEYNFDKRAVLKESNVLPTQTYYTFECGNVQLDLIFTSPFIPDDLSLVSAPINFITYNVRSVDGKEHDVDIYFDTDASWAQNKETQPVKVSLEKKKGINYIKSGVINQIIFDKKGDNVGIDWGYFYLGFNDDKNECSVNIGDDKEVKYSFLKNEAIDKMEVGNNYRFDCTPTMSVTKKMGKVGRDGTGDYLMVGYDNIYAYTLFNKQEMGLWRDNGKKSIYDVFENMNENYHRIMKRCRRFDESLMNEAVKVGGKKYADLCAIAYRQTMSAHILGKTSNDDIIYLSKENFSGGFIGTVDVAYPSVPLFLLYNTDLAKGMLNPIFIYVESGKWQKEFAPHDLGMYPNAEGTLYPVDMPIEESGNMIIMTAAVCAVDKDYNYAKKHWDVLTKWSDYLVKEGLNPSSQVCTDDFMGKQSHNCNLSIKSIIGIGCYAKMAKMIGENDVYKKYNAIAKERAIQWEELARCNDHYKLSFDNDDSWGLKYNLVWDEILSLDLFPRQVSQKEVKYYLLKQKQFGIPLDSRTNFSKADWIMWAACLASEQNDFEALIDGLYNYANNSVNRLPLSDWYYSNSGQVTGFRARSVVGAFYLKMLKERMK